MKYPARTKKFFASADTVMQIIGAVLVGFQFGWKTGLASWCFIQVLRPVIKL